MSASLTNHNCGLTLRAPSCASASAPAWIYAHVPAHSLQDTPTHYYVFFRNASFSVMHFCATAPPARHPQRGSQANPLASRRVVHSPLHPPHDCARLRGPPPSSSRVHTFATASARPTTEFFTAKSELLYGLTCDRGCACSRLARLAVGLRSGTVVPCCGRWTHIIMVRVTLDKPGRRAC